MPKDPQSFPFFVFGNKKDLEGERQVQTNQAREWCRTNRNIPYQETSAIDCECIEQAFDSITKTLLNKTLEMKQASSL